MSESGNVLFERDLRDWKQAFEWIDDDDNELAAKTGEELLKEIVSWAGSEIREATLDMQAEMAEWVLEDPSRAENGNTVSAVSGDGWGEG